MECIDINLGTSWNALKEQFQKKNTKVRKLKNKNPQIL